MADVVLKVGGAAYSGWTRMRVTTGIESLAGGFELELTERWTDGGQVWPINEEQECSIELDGHVVITGYVDRRRLSYSASEHSVEVTGRDKAGMLVDCSAILKSWQFDHLSLIALARKLAEPFGLTVTAEQGVTGTITLKTNKTAGNVTAGGAGKASGTGVPKPPKKFSVDPGESAFEVLDRACRLAGCLPISDGKGGIVLSRAGSTRASTSLVEGQNVLAASTELDAANRYHTYVVTGQRPGEDSDFGLPVATAKGEAVDAGVKRTARRLLVRAESAVTAEAAKVRAQWEATVRAARSQTVAVAVQGWTQADGSLWRANQIASVKLPTLGVNGDMLIAGVSYTLDDSGSLAQLSLKRPDAFKPEPVLKPTGLWSQLANGVK